MAERLHPGVYVEEKSSGSKPIEAVGTSTAAFVGVAARGVPGLPTLVTSFDEYRSRFGGHLPKERGFLGMAVAGFFTAGGRRAYVVRVLPSSASTARQESPGATRYSPAAGTPAPALQFTAKGKGRWAEHIRIEIANATNFPDEAFRAEVIWSENGSARTMEIYDDLRMDPEHPDYFAEIINEGSRYVQVSDEFALANDANTGSIVPIPSVVPRLEARTLSANDSYTVNEGTTLELTWTDAAGGDPRTKSVTFEGGGLSFSDSIASLTATELRSFLDASLRNDDNSRDFRTVPPTPATRGSITINAPAVGTQDISGETLLFTIGGVAVSIPPIAGRGRIVINAPAAQDQDLAGETLQFTIAGVQTDIVMNNEAADAAVVDQVELSNILGRLLGPDNPVQIVGDQVIVHTRADAGGTAPAFAQTPGNNNLTVNATAGSAGVDRAPEIPDGAAVTQAQLVLVFTTALGPNNPVETSGDQVIVRTRANDLGTAPQFSQTPNANSLAIAGVQAGAPADDIDRVAIEPNIATRGRIIINAPATQAQDLSGETLNITIAGVQTDIVMANEAADASAVSRDELAEILERRLGPDSLVDVVGDQVIARTRASAAGTAPALGQTPGNNSLTTTLSAGLGGLVIESLDGIVITASEAPSRNFPRTIRDIGFPGKARGYEQNAAANPAARPQNTTDAIRLVGGTDGNGEPGVSDFSASLSSLDRTEVNLVAMPGKNAAGYLSTGLSYCDNRGDCFFLADGPGHIDDDLSVGPVDAKAFIEGLPNRSKNAAMFYPWIEVPDPVGAGRNPKRFVPPCGHVAGICARTDINRGVWKAPAGIEAVVSGAVGLQYELIDAEQDLLNPVSLNCIRRFSGTGIVTWGSRTLSSDPEWRYLPVRRTALFLKESLRRGLQWAVFEPNDRELWDSIRINIDAFMLSLFRQGAFQGATPDEAFLVVCDRSTNPQDLVDQGIVTAKVAFAPLKPAEFVVIEIAQKTLVAG